jgi:hypothetical protein
MTNIAICEQTPGYKGRMMDGSRVAVRSRDKDGNRKMDFYDVPAEVYVDLTDSKLAHGAFRNTEH